MQTLVCLDNVLIFLYIADNDLEALLLPWPKEIVLAVNCVSGCEEGDAAKICFGVEDCAGDEPADGASATDEENVGASCW